MSAAVESDSETETTPLPAHKPAFLKRVQIRNYKSIAFCDVTLEPLTLLVGRNGSGKSNFLDALDFLAELMDNGVSDLIDSRGGWSEVYPKATAKGSVEFRIDFHFNDGKFDWNGEYSLVIANPQNDEVILEEEELKCTSVVDNYRLGFQSTHGNITLDIDNRLKGKYSGLSSPSIQPDLFNWLGLERTILGVINLQPFSTISSMLKYSNVYNFNPSVIRSPQRVRKTRMLAMNGSNLADIIAQLNEYDATSLKRAFQFLQSVVPEIVGVRVTDIGDGHRGLQFQSAPTVSRPQIDFLSSRMSDGTIRALACLIAAVYSPIRTASGQSTLINSGFIGIEEPETSLHPAAMHALVDALDEATLLKQIILTTHSSEILDNPTIKPENVRVVRMIDGHTVIAPVDKVYHDIIRRELNTLGGLERENQLEPDLDDIDRQQKLADAPRETAA
jgi:predicted ATPase